MKRGSPNYHLAIWMARNSKFSRDEMLDAINKIQVVAGTNCRLEDLAVKAIVIAINLGWTPAEVVFEFSDLSEGRVRRLPT